MTEATQDGADVVERLRALARHEHSDLSIGHEAADIIDVHRKTIEIANAGWNKDHSELTRLSAENEALKEALCDLSIFYGDDTEAREVLRSDFTGPEPLLMDDDALRESVWNNARAALSKALGEGQ
jgi:hypothetical protein